MNQDTTEKVFIESFAAYGDAIFRFCILKVSDTALAEDMTQEAFMRYWQYLQDDREMTNTRSFLYTIVNNLAKDWYKKRKSDSLDVRLEAGAQISDGGASPETMASYTEVLTAIEDMEPQDKEVLLLRHVEGLAPKDIADILQESANLISVRLNRATHRLQEKLGI